MGLPDGAPAGEPPGGLVIEWIQLMLREQKVGAIKVDTLDWSWLAVLALDKMEMIRP